MQTMAPLQTVTTAELIGELAHRAGQQPRTDIARSLRAMLEVLAAAWPDLERDGRPPVQVSDLAHTWRLISARDAIAGWLARYGDLPVTACPHPSGSPAAEAWIAGWCIGDGNPELPLDGVASFRHACHADECGAQRGQHACHAEGCEALPAGTVPGRLIAQCAERGCHLVRTDDCPPSVCAAGCQMTICECRSEPDDTRHGWHHEPGCPRSWLEPPGGLAALAAAVDPAPAPEAPSVLEDLGERLRRPLALVDQIQGYLERLGERREGQRIRVVDPELGNVVVSHGGAGYSAHLYGIAPSGDVWILGFGIGHDTRADAEMAAIRCAEQCKADSRRARSS